jgi:hypothetical protein
MTEHAPPEPALADAMGALAFAFAHTFDGLAPLFRAKRNLRNAKRRIEKLDRKRMRLQSRGARPRRLRRLTSKEQRLGENLLKRYNAVIALRNGLGGGSP